MSVHPPRSDARRPATPGRGGSLSAPATDAGGYGGSPPLGDDWTALVSGPLPRSAAHDWAVRDDCGAIVAFAGTARDRSEGRSGVTLLEYEAYETQVVPRLDDVVTELRKRWPSVGRVALVHRVGEVPVGEAAVLVVVSAPHRDDAFEAARFGIDAVKASVPIWKRERWDGGEDWGSGSQDLVGSADVAGWPDRAEQAR